MISGTVFELVFGCIKKINMDINEKYIIKIYIKLYIINTNIKYLNRN